MQFAADEKRFFRAWPEPAPFPLFSTGVGLDRGAADPHWEITQISTEVDFKPRPAIVADPCEFYLPDKRDSFQWISLSKDLKAMPGGAPRQARTLGKHGNLGADCAF
jgi:hypothetical protein